MLCVVWAKPLITSTERPQQPLEFLKREETGASWSLVVTLIPSWKTRVTHSCRELLPRISTKLAVHRSGFFPHGPIFHQPLWRAVRLGHPFGGKKWVFSLRAENQCREDDVFWGYVFFFPKPFISVGQTVLDTGCLIAASGLCFQEKEKGKLKILAL